METKTPEKSIVKHAGTTLPSGLTRLEPKSFAELEYIASSLSKSDIVPKDLIGKPANILLVLMHGHEIGLSAAQALTSIMVVNGRPSLWGDAVMGLVVASGLLESSRDWFDENTQTSFFAVKRKGQPEIVRSFSLEDAKAAKLTEKPGPWQQYRKRMQFNRCRAWALRDAFSDVLKGLRVTEEERDIIDVTATAKIYDIPKSSAPMSDAPAPAEEQPRDNAGSEPAAPATEQPSQDRPVFTLKGVSKAKFEDKVLTVVRIKENDEKFGTIDPAVAVLAEKLFVEVQAAREEKRDDSVKVYLESDIRGDKRWIVSLERVVQETPAAE